MSFIGTCESGSYAKVLAIHFLNKLCLAGVQAGLLCASDTCTEQYVSNRDLVTLIDEKLKSWNWDPRIDHQS